MPVLLLVSGVDQTSKVPFNSYDLTDSLMSRGDTLSFRMPVASSEISIRPQSGQSVELWVDGVLEFAGDISSVSESKLINADYFDYELTCQDYCVSPETPVLTADLQWLRAAELRQGDELWAFDENPPTTGSKRRFRFATVVETEIRPMSAFDIYLSSGECIRATPNHRWLVQTYEGGVLKLCWVRTEELKRRLESIDGRRTRPVVLTRYLSVWDRDDSYDGGFLAAAFDSEGWLTDRDGRLSLGFSQRDNELLRRVESLLTEKGFRYTKKTRADGVIELSIGDRQSVWRFLGQYRPPRLLTEWLESKSSQRLCGTEEVVIEHIEDVGTQDMVALTSSSQTYFASGFGAHNTRRLDRHLVVIQEIGPDLAGNIVRTILSEFAPEFAGDLSGIADGPTIGKQQFDYVPISNVLDQISQQTQMVWFVEPTKRVVLTDQIEYEAPISSYDVDTELQLGDFTWSEAVEQVKNRIYLKDAAVKDANQRTDEWLADGSTSFFKAFSEPYSEEDASVTGTKPDGTKKEYEIFLDPLDNDQGTLNGTPGTVALCILNWGLRFPLEDLPEAGELIEFVYNPVRPGDIVYMVEDTDSQAMMRSREGTGDGVYEHMVSLPDVRVASEDPIVAYGEILLERIAWPEVRGQVSSLEVVNWKAGQTFTITSSKRDLYDQKTYWKSGQATKSSVRVWVQSVRKKILGERADGTTIMQADVEFANSIFGRV